MLLLGLLLRVMLLLVASGGAAVDEAGNGVTVVARQLLLQA